MVRLAALAAFLIAPVAFSLVLAGGHVISFMLLMTFALLLSLLTGPLVHVILSARIWVSAAQYVVAGLIVGTVVTFPFVMVVWPTNVAIVPLAMALSALSAFLFWAIRRPDKG